MPGQAPSCVTHQGQPSSLGKASQQAGLLQILSKEMLNQDSPHGSPCLSAWKSPFPTPVPSQPKPKRPEMPVPTGSSARLSL